jgi:hypothetical protein
MPIQRITSRVIEDGIIAAADIADGSITTAKIADGNVTSDKIVSVANTKITGNIISSQITSVANTQITGNITSSQIISVANTQITGNITGTQIAPNVTLSGTITATAFSGNGASLTGIVSGGATPPITTIYNAPATYTKPGTIKFALVDIFGSSGGAGGGGSGTNPGVTGGVGATTSFGPLVSATGGNGGVGGNAYSITPGGVNPGHAWPTGNPGNPASPGNSGSTTVSPSALTVVTSPRNGLVTSGFGGTAVGGAGYGHGSHTGHHTFNEMEGYTVHGTFPIHQARHAGNGGHGGTGGGTSVWIPGANVTPTVAVTAGAGGNPGAAGTGTVGSSVLGNAGAAGTTGRITLTEFF